MRLIYDVKRRVWLLRLLVLLMIGIGLGCVWCGIYIAQHGMHGAEGGVLEPLHVRLAYGAVLVLTGVAAMVCTAFWDRRYVLRLELDDATDEFHIATPGLLEVHRIVLPREDLGGRSYYLPGHASGWLVRARGYRFPFVIDERGTAHDPDIFYAVLGLDIEDADCEAYDEEYDEEYQEEYQEEVR